MGDVVESKNVQMRGPPLVDGESSVATLSKNWIEHRGLEPLESTKGTAGVSGKTEELPQLIESMEPEVPKKSGKFNLRKSLAWDAAFFTSAGVLDPEELCNMIEGVEKDRKNVLSGIQEEDMEKSTESISTLDSDCLTLESLEADLFQDIRASIQKSRKASNVTNSSCKEGLRVGDVQAPVNSLKLMNHASRNKVKPNTASKKLISTTQGADRTATAKQGLGCPPVPQKKSVARSGGRISTISEIPKGGRTNPIPTATMKRATLDTNRVKLEKDNNVKGSTVVRKVDSSCKMPGSSISRFLVPRPAPSSKSSSTATKTDSTASCSSIDSFGSVSSSNAGRLPSSSTRKKIDSRNVNPFSAASPLKTSSKTAVRKRTEPRNPHLPANLTSSAKPASSLSPASSVSEWSCESTSSTSTLNPSSNNARNLGTWSPCRTQSADHLNGSNPLGYQSQLYGQSLVEQKSRITRLPSPRVTEALPGHVTLTGPASGKPSGLRMPSPKIGFFDGAKSVVRTPKGGIPSRPPPVGCAKVKIDPKVPTPGLKSSSLLLPQEPSNASTKSLVALKAVRSPGLSPKIQSSVSKKRAVESPLKVKDAGVKEPLGTETDLDTCLKKQTSPSVEVVPPQLEDTGDLPGNHGNSSSQIVETDTFFGKDNPKGNFEIPIDGLEMHLGSTDREEVQKELSDDSFPHHPQRSLGDSELPCTENLHLDRRKEEAMDVLPAEVAAGPRLPLADKSSVCNADGAFETSTGSPELVEKTGGLSLSESSVKENNS